MGRPGAYDMKQPPHSLRSLPPEGESVRLGRPGAYDMKQPPHSLRSLPRGSQHAWGGPARTDMDHIVFLTGRLAEKSLIRVLESMAPTPFSWEIREIGLQVAALMTADMIRRRVPTPLVAQRVIVPGRCRGDLVALTEHYGVRFERGPEEVKDLPQFFGREALPFDLTRYRPRFLPRSSTRRGSISMA